MSVAALVTRPPGVLCDYYSFDPSPVDVSVAAKEARIVVEELEDVNASEGTLSKFAADYFIISNYQQILKPVIFCLPRKLTINFHPSPLPKYAGVHPFFWMARNHETVGGVTAIAVNEIIDGGDIVDQMLISLRGDEEETEIRTLHLSASVQLLTRVVSRFEGLDEIQFPRQDLSQRSYYSWADYHRVTKKPA